MITVCYNGGVGESFYQPEMFWASDDVNVLAAKDAIDENASLFILPILKNLESVMASPINGVKM